MKFIGKFQGSKSNNEGQFISDVRFEPRTAGCVELEPPPGYGYVINDLIGRESVCIQAARLKVN